MNLYRRILAAEPAAFTLQPRALWMLTGPDATRYLNGQVTNDVARLEDGHAFYAAVCTAKGRMEGDISIAKHAGSFYIDADAVLGESLGARLDKYLIADDAAFEDVSEAWTLTHVFGSSSPAPPEGGFAVAYGRFGLPGHDVWTPAGASLPTETEADAESVETLRIENAIPRWGAELTDHTLPPEAGPHMLDAISYTKGCYVGQETIARLKSVGHVNRSLVLLKASGDKAPAVGAKISQGEREIGAITSSGFSPRLEKGIALGYVQRQFTDEGVQLIAGGIPLTVTKPLRQELKAA